MGPMLGDPFWLHARAGTSTYPPHVVEGIGGVDEPVPHLALHWLVGLKVRQPEVKPVGVLQRAGTRPDVVDVSDVRSLGKTRNSAMCQQVRAEQ